jgi:hypothetical protein
MLQAEDPNGATTRRRCRALAKKDERRSLSDD